MIHLAWAVLTAPSSAAEPADYAGRFVASSETIAPVVEAAVEEGAAQFSFFLRGIARKRLTKTLAAAEWIEFEPTEGGIRIGNASRPEGVTTPLDGSKTPTTDAAGNPATIRRWMESGVLKVEACAEGGSCFLKSFELDGDTMLVTRETRSPQLTTPITYRLRYTRKAE